MLDKAEKISGSNEITQIEAFSSAEIQLSNRDKSSSSIIGVEEEKIDLK